MIAFVVVLYESAIDAFIKTWTAFMLKRHPEYQADRDRLVVVGAVVMMVLSVVIFCAIFALIEWLFPEVFDLVRFD